MLSLNEQACRQLSKHMMLGQRLMEALGTHPVWPLLTPQAWNVLLHVPGRLPISVLGAPRRAEAWVFPDPAVGGRGPFSPEDAWACWY